METIDINKMTPEQLAAIEAQLAEKKRAEKEMRTSELQTLVELENETIIEMIQEAEVLSNSIVEFKRKWIEKLRPLIDMKIGLGKAKADQEQYQFKTSDSECSAVIRYNKTDKYDDGIQVGVGFAKEWLAGQADGEKGQRLVSIIDDLLTRDSKGSYSPVDLLKFIKHAEEVGDELLLKAADAVKQSIYEEATSVSLLAFKRDEKGVKRQLPLSATKA